MNNTSLKRPVSVLVVLHDGKGHALLLQRHGEKVLWQSVTGSIEEGESLETAALREVREETGIVLSPNDLHNCHLSTEYDIYPQWRNRYPLGIARNTEHTFRAVIDRNSSIVLAADEHQQYQWLPLREAARLAFSPSNQAALMRLADESTN